MGLSGDVAQLGEHLVRNEGVGGSNPLVSTNSQDAGGTRLSCRFRFSILVPLRTLKLRATLRASVPPRLQTLPTLRRDDGPDGIAGGNPVVMCNLLLRNL